MVPGFVDPKRTRAFLNSPARFVSPHADPHDSAEFMLDVIGAGAAVTSTIDRHDVWEKSPEVTTTTREIQRVDNEGRNRRPAVETKLHTEYSTTWAHQTLVVARLPSGAIPPTSRPNSH